MQVELAFTSGHHKKKLGNLQMQFSLEKKNVFVRIMRIILIITLA